MYVIKLENTVTHNVYRFECDDINGGDKLYYLFNVNTLDLDDGEYLLTLCDADDNVLSEDILKIGDFNPQTLQYKAGENTYISIELEAKIGHKEVQIDTINTKVLPDEGYDGMSDVIVDASPIYNSARREGYNEGFDIGQSDGYEIGKYDGQQIGYEEGYAVGNEEGFNKGNEEGLKKGYEQGYEVGVQESYGNGYEDGYNTAGAEIGETARVLEVTENGNYFSKYSKNEDYVFDTQPTGDDEFYNYANLEKASYNTNIVPNTNTKLEFWYKGDEAYTDDGWNVIIGSDKDDYDYSFNVTYYSKNIKKLRARIGEQYLDFELDDETIWNHFVVDAGGVYVNGEYKGSVNTEGLNSDTPFYINATPTRPSARMANGSFGMIKITNDGTEYTIIPTSDGFLNLTTGEILSVVTEGGYEYIEQSRPAYEGELYRTLNVNVTPKIHVKDGLKFGYSRYKELPEFYDFTGVNDMSQMFYDCQNLGELRWIDTSEVTDMSYAFYNCTSLKTIAAIDTRNVTNMTRMFNSCRELVSVPALDASSLVRQNYGLFGSGNSDKLTDFGGLINLKASIDGNYSFDKCPNLSYDSCINILNGLYDFIGNGETPASNQGKLKVHSNFLTTVGDGLSIGTSKGWTITA